MVVDNITLEDLSIFHAEEDQSVFNTLNYTLTNGGRHWLRHLLSTPYSDLKSIIETQQTLQLIIKHHDSWPRLVSNGTIMVIERFYESQVDEMPRRPNLVSAVNYKLLHHSDYSLTSYTTGHAIDFLKGMQQMIDLFAADEKPQLLRTIIEKMNLLLQKTEVKEMMAVRDKTMLTMVEKLRFGHFILFHFHNQVNDLIDLYGRLDAYYSLATAAKEKQLHFPTFSNEANPYIAADGLYHILLKNPVPYHLEMNHSNNFIFLTGANMAGKSTFIKAVGLAVYLAHIGMAVSAASMELSLFDGLLSNIHVTDNIMKGESYFFNEVQRIKNTIIKINDGKKWLVLIDELFKGTNVQDAMRCSSEVIKGLLKIKNSLFILSTHLYEIGEELKPYENIAFRYFETGVNDEQLSFSYQLKEGVSNDRLGYLILKREGVVDMINNL
jgi:DNA mismatch repair protein MutS